MPLPEKPKLRFVPKKERERQAAEKAKNEAEDLRRKQQEDARKKAESEKKWLEKANAPAENHRDHDTDRPPERQQQDRRSGQNGKGASKKGGDARMTEEEFEKKQLRERYLGPEVNRNSSFSAAKKRKRPTEFKFDWDEGEEPRSRMISLRRGHHQQGRVIVWDRRGRDLARKRAERFGFGKRWTDKALNEMTARDWRIFKEDFGIATKGGAIPNPMRNWDESGLPGRLLDIVHRVGYNDPTPIQRAAIPIALQARDLIGVAVTGSGKTASFLLPLLVYISDLPPLGEMNKNDGPYGLILAPTRELVQQIESEANKFATPLGFRVVSIVGGHSLEEQAFALRNGAEIIVATPGRLVDCIERRLLVLGQCCYVIMDEADRMIDLGFEEPVNKILDALPVSNEKPDTDEAENAQLMKRYLGGKDRYRQTMMYTATMPSVVERIAKKYLRRPAIVTIGNIGEAVDTVEQRVEFVSGEDKRKKRLQQILFFGRFRASHHRLRQHQAELRCCGTRR
ncbi:pre-mRNA-splicing ATP-dependent RNA helicase PRP28 [Verticillium alfalfae VaMs.102]|uniref:RNA helicase n=1 Tax=Verticillium alfalfae (strain VaMs.102 / ATCC MYA-4576 / FGSC 10136) TaxID=526221 RepID=C9SIN6_VERA1|nr:pre-mRNA-splicing ATP-dependent RNA helicase PRP28 [Verticillium alfalfae VaMs.102]EEY18809.1 pre-mRNA-splicing ATP-dependent RNA helicase PRP28 [Verticillium alfalfae VaMs.102]